MPVKTQFITFLSRIYTPQAVVEIDPRPVASYSWNSRMLFLDGKMTDAIMTHIPTTSTDDVGLVGMVGNQNRQFGSFLILSRFTMDKLHYVRLAGEVSVKVSPISDSLPQAKQAADRVTLSFARALGNTHEWRGWDDGVTMDLYSFRIPSDRSRPIPNNPQTTPTPIVWNC